MFTDTHTHLYLPEFDTDLNSVVLNAKNNLVSRFLLPNIDLKTLPKLIELCKKNKSVFFPMIGLHPCSVTTNYLMQLDNIYKHFSEEKFIAIGEIGIDLYWDKTLINEQTHAFSLQIDNAKKHNLPIVIHCRNSFNEIYNVIVQKKNKLTRGVFHCFSGDYKQAKQIIELGLLLGIGGVVTFKNSKLKEIVKKIGLEHIILETDSPYLAPEPMRGSRNEPKYIPIIAQKIAEIKNLDISKVAEQTQLNVDNLFFNK